MVTTRGQTSDSLPTTLPLEDVNSSTPASGMNYPVVPDNLLAGTTSSAPNPNANDGIGNADVGAATPGPVANRGRGTRGGRPVRGSTRGRGTVRARGRGRGVPTTRRRNVRPATRGSSQANPNVSGAGAASGQDTQASGASTSEVRATPVDPNDPVPVLIEGGTSSQATRPATQVPRSVIGTVEQPNNQQGVSFELHPFIVQDASSQGSPRVESSAAAAARLRRSDPPRTANRPVQDTAVRPSDATTTRQSQDQGDPNELGFSYEVQGIRSDNPHSGNRQVLDSYLARRRASEAIVIPDSQDTEDTRARKISLFSPKKNRRNLNLLGFGVRPPTTPRGTELTATSSIPRSDSQRLPYKLSLPELPLFRGLDGEDLAKFLHSFEVGCSIRAVWSDDARGRLLIAHLRETALSIATQHALYLGDTTYSSLKTMLLEWFLQPDQDVNLMLRWNARRQRPNESPLSFAVDLLDLAQRLSELTDSNVHKSEQETILKFVSRLLPDLRKVVQPLEFTSIDEAIKSATKHAVALGWRNGISKRNNPQQQQQRGPFGRNNGYANLTARAGDNGPGSRQSGGLASVICHQCGKPGHYRRQCPEKRPLENNGRQGPNKRRRGGGSGGGGSGGKHTSYMTHGGSSSQGQVRNVVQSGKGSGKSQGRQSGGRQGQGSNTRQGATLSVGTEFTSGAHAVHGRQSRGQGDIELTGSPGSDHFEDGEGYVMSVIKFDFKDYFVLDSGATEHLCGSTPYLRNVVRVPSIRLHAANGAPILCEQAGIAHVIGQDSDVTLRVHNVMIHATLPVNLLSIAKLQQDGITVTFGDETCALRDSRTNRYLCNAFKVGNLWALKLVPPPDDGPSLVGVTTRSGTTATRAQPRATRVPSPPPVEDYPALPEAEASRIRSRLESAETSTATDDAISLPMVVTTDVADQAAAADKDSAPDRDSFELWHRRLGHVHDRRLLDLSRDPNSDVPSLRRRVFPGDHSCRICAMSKSSSLPSRSKFKTVPSVGTHWYLDTIGPMGCKGLNGARFVLHLTEAKERIKVSFALTRKSEALDAVMRLLRLVPGKFGTKVTHIHADNAGEFVSMEPVLARFGVSMSFAAVAGHNTNAIIERAHLSHVNVVRSLLQDSNVDGYWWTFASRQATYLLNRLPTRSTGRVPLNAIKADTSLSHVKRFGCRCYLHVPSSHRHKLASTSLEGIFLGNLPNGMYRVYIPSSNLLTISRDVRFDEQSFPVLRKPRVRPRTAVSQYDGLLFSTTPPALGEAAFTVRDAMTPSEQAVLDKLNPSTIRIPKNIAEARRTPEWPFWKASMLEEISVMYKNGTITDATPPPGRRPLSSRFVYELKLNSDKTKVLRFRSRLVAGGFSQRPVDDYTNTYAPVLDWTSFMLFTHLAMVRGYKTRMFDISKAFLYGKLAVRLWMAPPFVLRDVLKPESTHTTWELGKSIYGLKQASRRWWQRVSQDLATQGFRLVEGSNNVFVRYRDDEQPVWLLVYVDDIIGLGPDTDELQQVAKRLNEHYPCKDLGQLTEFIGVQVRKLANGTVILSQRDYADRLVKKFNYEHCRHRSFIGLLGEETDVIDNDTVLSKLYRHAVGAIGWLATRTRPDLAAVHGALGRAVQQPQRRHLNLLKRVIQYIGSTKHYGIPIYDPTRTAPRVLSNCLASWSDAAYAPGEHRRRTVAGNSSTVTRRRSTGDPTSSPPRT